MLRKAIVLITLQYIHRTTHYVVYLKLTQCFMSTISQKKKQEELGSPLCQKLLGGQVRLGQRDVH